MSSNHHRRSHHNELYHPPHSHSGQSVYDRNFPIQNDNNCTIFDQSIQTSTTSSNVNEEEESSPPQPQFVPPKPPRSAFMCYTDTMKGEIMKSLNDESNNNTHGEGSNTTEEKILNMVAVKWKSLTDRERAEWEEVSRQDKVRFAREKAEYKGPWEIPKRRARKHPLAPKRPMSAFLKYSQKRRQEVKEANPEMNNTDISRLLGELWRAADATEKEPYVESEKVERAMYNEAIASWREEQAQLDIASRTNHHSTSRHSVAVEPVVKKKRREQIKHTLSDTSRAATSSSSHSVGKVVDRRIFRSYSGSSHPVENRLNPSDQKKYHPAYYSVDNTRSHSGKGDPNSFYHHKPMDVQFYKLDPTGSASTSGTGSIQPVEYPPRHHLHAPYRQPPPPYTIPHGENRHTTSSDTGSDFFEHSFHDPEPPFNPRQTRPSSHFNTFYYP